MVEERTLVEVYTDGIKLYIHENEVFPSANVPDKNLPHETESYINVFPEITTASSQLRAIPAESRGCVFPDEIQLKYVPCLNFRHRVLINPNFFRYFKEYKRINCEVEWLMQKTYERCGCLPFFYPEVKDMPICTFVKIPCLVQNYGE